MKKYAEIGSPWLMPLSKLKYWVVVQPYITNESLFLIKIYVHEIDSLTNLNFFNTELRKSFPRESKAFSISIVTRNIPVLNLSMISVMSEINLPLYTIKVFFT